MLCFHFAPLINLGSGGIYTDNQVLSIIFYNSFTKLEVQI